MWIIILEVLVQFISSVDKLAVETQLEADTSEKSIHYDYVHACIAVS